MAGYAVKQLDVETWPDFARLVERHNGVWGGCWGWCQFGSPDELPRIKFGRAYRQAATKPPTWRITCFFVDREYRHHGALTEIARLGGGTVESSPEDVDGRKVSNSFLYNATLAMFEAQGFNRARRLGKNNWLVTKRVRARRTAG